MATLTGASVGIVGGGLSIAAVSLILSPFTFGASAIAGLTIAGIAVGSAGAATGITSAFTRIGLQKKAKKTAKGTIQNYNSEVNYLRQIIHKFDEISWRDLENFEEVDCSSSSQGLRNFSMNNLLVLRRYVTQLTEIQHAIENMRTNNTIFPSNDDEVSINYNEVVNFSHCLDRFVEIRENIHRILGGTGEPYFTDVEVTNVRRPEQADFAFVSPGALVRPGVLSPLRVR